MAKATANCTCKICGKRFERTAIKRNCREAESWIAWAEANITTCPDCEEKEYAAAGKEAAAESAAEGLPALTGSERQVAWAEQIRREKLAEMTNISKQFADAGMDEGVANTELVIRYLSATQTRAAWWIDNRSTKVNVIIKQSFKAAKAAQ